MQSNDNALSLVFSRNAFYKRLHFLVLAALVLCWIIIITLAWMIFYLVQNPPHPLYFATDEIGRLIHIIPVNTPNMSPEETKKWAIEAVEKSLSYDYINYRGQLQNAEKYFTSYGWTKYMSALSLSGNLRALTARKQIVIARVIGQPKVIADGLLKGAHAWKYTMPVLITYMMPPYNGSADSQYSNALNVTVLVQRQAVLEGYKGLGTVQLIAEFATSGAP